MDFGYISTCFNFLKNIGIALSILSLVLMVILGHKMIFEDKNTIISTKPITPKIELVIENNKVDTIYIYTLEQN
jgi:hypothetical protein